MNSENVILLAEDNSDEIELINHMFEKNHIQNQLIVIQEGDEVLDYLFRQSNYAHEEYPLPSLVLLGLQMPKVDGLEILQKIRDNKRTSSFPVLILISHKSEKELVRESHLRAEGFIQKPLTLNKLKKAINKIDFSLDCGPKEKGVL